MIREFISSLRTPASKMARELGYLYESIALQERFRRRKKSWQSHIAKCREATLTAVESSPAHKTMLILGSGPLLEVPMDDLLKRFERIVLADVIHPREVRVRWGKHPKVTLVELDLLGIGHELLKWTGGPLPKPHPPDLNQFNADFILSANCLSQLALRPRERLSKKIAESELNDYCESLSTAHIAQLRTLKTAHLVIADFETRVLNSQGEILEKSMPFFDPKTMKLQSSWTWMIAPRGEMHHANSIEMLVGAFKI